MTDLPTLTTVTDAVDFMRKLSDTEEVFVLWNVPRGMSLEIAVLGGTEDGTPRAFLTPDVYRDLCEEGLIGEDGFEGGLPSRRLHDFIPTRMVG